MSKLVRGTLILTAATFFSKFLGLIFVIPLERLFGTSAGALYSYAYQPYTVILSIATLGLPLAVSKFVSKYNALGDYATGRRLLRTGMLLMSLTGLIAFLGLFFSAEWIAGFLVKEGSKGNSISDVTMVIRLVSTALIIVPSMSLIRGYFQGFQSMGPTALSQVVEQIVRIGFILISATLILKVFGGQESTAVGFATFAAFIAALASLFILIWYWKKRKPHLDKLVKTSKRQRISLVKMYKELIGYAIPFVAVGLAIPLYSVIDTFTINKALMNALAYSQPEAETFYAVMTTYSQKLIMIPVSLSTGLALTVIPLITSYYTKKETHILHNQVTKTFEIVLFLTVPAGVGLSLLAVPAYSFLFSEEVATGGYVLSWYAPTAILFALFSVSAAILQGINQQKFAVYSLLAGVFVKLSLNYILIASFGIAGAIIATNFGYLISISINLFIIKRETDYSFKPVFKRTILIGMFIGLMTLAVVGVKSGIESMFGANYGNSWFSGLVLIVGVIAGAGVYLYMSHFSGLLQHIFGDRLERFLRKKRMRSNG
ncbi:polysaccharide biosynthesis protein [Alkalihalobacillus sp. AL-G]|uniref:putative polysaccharide biosynthesis protein n=1 Tax=Alkalihalobacillus sp. AL-G TaxID=2926399 RepID=UPI00272ABAB0|nr:polysaccharide biosynthesis protein [Alkalihalobacillus sp. AL-G]WLD92439.1 polysaccharide biosynthesis protein [Alkalihalobacillus sp. AL-G]